MECILNVSIEATLSLFTKIVSTSMYVLFNYSFVFLKGNLFGSVKYFNGCVFNAGFTR